MRWGQGVFGHELIFIKCLLYNKYFPLLHLVLTQPDVKSGLIFIRKMEFPKLSN